MRMQTSSESGGVAYCLPIGITSSKTKCVRLRNGRSLQHPKTNLCPGDCRCHWKDNSCVVHCLYELPAKCSRVFVVLIAAKATACMYMSQTQVQCRLSRNSWKKLVMHREGLKLTNPRSFWYTSVHTLGTMPGYGRVWLADIFMLTLMITEDTCLNYAVTTHCAPWTLSFNTKMCTIPVVQRFSGSTVTHWFRRSFSWASFSVGRSC